MSDPQHRLQEVAWHELFPWLFLVRSVRIALMARVLALGALGIIAMTLGWRAINWLFPVADDPVVHEWLVISNRWVWESAEFAIETSARSVDDVFVSAADRLLQAPLALWLYLTRPFFDLFNAETTLGFVHLLACCVWELAVWGLVGGAITRIAALKFTRDEAPGFVPALRGAAAKLPSYAVAPLIALAGAAIFAVQLVLLGLVIRLDVLMLVAAIVWPFVLMLGLLMAILLIGALVGWPLMWATISVEGTDAFDALSRSYAYVYQRPLRLLWYVFVAALLAMVSMFVVKAFAASAIALGDWSVSWGLDRPTMRRVVNPDEAAIEPNGPLPLVPRLVDETPFEPAANEEPAVVGEPAVTEQPEAHEEAVTDDDADAENDVEGTDEAAQQRQDTWLERASRSMIFFWKSLMAALAAGYQASFLWVSAVGVYLLLRRDIDGAEMDEVFVEQDEEFGLPPLEDDAATGVPEVTPGGEARPGSTTATDQPPSTSP